MRVFLRFVLLLTFFLGTGSEAAAFKLTVLGDSLSDEYAEASYGTYAENWVEQLAVHAGVDFGPTAAEAGVAGGSWDATRRTGYQCNWANSGANSTTMLSGGQHTGAAQCVTAEGATHAVLFIGANDFFPSSAAYLGIYFGTWTEAEIIVYKYQVASNISNALTTLTATGVPVLVATVPDYGLAPTTQQFLVSAAARQNVAEVLDELNLVIHNIAQAHEVGVIDINAAALAIFGAHGSPNATLDVGNVSIPLAQKDTTGGGNPLAAFVDDGIHPSTVLQGLVANLVMTGLNEVYGTGLPLFTEAEILAHRGIAYGGSETVEAQLGAYTDFVTDYTPVVEAVPSLSPGSLAALGFLLVASATLLPGMLRRRDQGP